MSQEKNARELDDITNHSYSSNPTSSYEMSSLEDRVFKLAREMMEKHYVLNTKNLYSLCTRVIKNEEKSSISNAISSLLRKKFLIEGKTLSRMDLLEKEGKLSPLFQKNYMIYVLTGA